jgi:hypothetical protein
VTYLHDDHEPMPCRTELTEAERLTLEEMSRNHPFRDFRPRALGVLALGKGHPPKVVADILVVTAQTVSTETKAGACLGLTGLLNGHKGGCPPKLTAALLDTAEAVARAEPCALKEIARRVREAHPESEGFSLDRLAAGLKARGLVVEARPPVAKKKALPRAVRDRPRNPEALPGGGAGGPHRPVLLGRVRLRQPPERAALLVSEGPAA